MPESKRAALAIAWGGTLVFGGSLVWFFYCYVIGFDRRASSAPGPRSAAIAVLIDVGLFSVFALHHSILARAGAKRRIKRIVTPELERSAYTWMASILFIGVCAWWQPVPGVVYRLDGLWRALGWAVQLTGVLLTLRASRALDVLDLAGVRQVEQKGAARRTHLSVTGLYGFVRHPLYFAWALMVFGAPDMTATRAVFAVVSTGYLAVAIPWEERSLVRTFGRDYVAYREKVRWRMLPWIY
jgi:protein-S-isoprenylcysteine O-methyltransferase Ste14